MPKGWRNDSARHSLAAKGVKTGRKPIKRFSGRSMSKLEILGRISTLRTDWKGFRGRGWMAQTLNKISETIQESDYTLADQMAQDMLASAPKFNPPPQIEANIKNLADMIHLAKGIKTGRKVPIRMNPKLVPMWNAIGDIDTVREALKKDNLFFRSLVDAKVELQRAVDNTAIGHIASAQKNLTIALGLLHDVSTAPDIWKQRQHLAPPMERAISEVRRAKQKLGEV